MSEVLEITGVCANDHCGYAVTGVHPTHCCVGCYKYDLKGAPYSTQWPCHGLRCRRISDASRLFVEAMELRQKKEEDEEKEEGKEKK